MIDRLNRAAGTWTFTIIGATLETLPDIPRGRTVLERVCIVGESAIPGLGARQAHGMAAWEGTDDPLVRAQADCLRYAGGLFGVPLVEGTDEDQPGRARRSRRAPTRARTADRPRRGA